MEDFSTDRAPLRWYERFVYLSLLAFCLAVWAGVAWLVLAAAGVMG